MRHTVKLTLAIVALSIGVVPGALATASTRVLAHHSSPLFYVALGDSYAQGYQPGFVNGAETLHGYTNQVGPLVVRRHTLMLRNFGCGGATSSSILLSIGCPAGALAKNGVPYPTTTQAAAALAFIATHRGKIGLITLSIGGNDFVSCAGATDAASCLLSVMPSMRANIVTLVAELRTVAGPQVPMIATSYPDVLLGAVLVKPANPVLAQLSVTAFSQIINPNLSAAYATQGVDFIDVTSATGAYIALTQTTSLAPYGVIPVAVANVCTLTWICTRGDIHPTALGYSLIARLVARQYLKLAT